MRQRSGVDRVRERSRRQGKHYRNIEAAVAILKRGDAVVRTFRRAVPSRFAAELGRVITIEQNRSPAAVGVADLANENRGVGRYRKGACGS